MNKHSKFQLRIFWDSRQQDVIDLQVPGEYIVGSSERADLHVPDNNVSSLHCAIYVDEDGQCFIHDLHSTNGTNLNGNIITGRRRLFSGDLVQLGYSTLLFLVINERRELLAHAS